MSRRAVQAGSDRVIVNFDDPGPVAERWWALATGRLVNEETGTPAAAPTSGLTSRPGVLVTATGDGSFALVARPWLACPPLLQPSYTFDATLAADGYLPVDIGVTVPSQQRPVVAPAPAAGSDVLALSSVAGLAAGQRLAIGPAAIEERGRIRTLGPGAQDVTLDGSLFQARNVGDPVVADAWTPVDLGAIPLRRAPVVIRGRAVERDPSTNIVAPVAGAVVSLVDFWTSLADVRAQLPGAMTDPNPATRAFMLAISPGLVTSRVVGPGQVAEQPLPPVLNDDRLLAAPAPAGASVFRISDRQALAAGDLLRIDAGDDDRAETVEVAGVTGFGPADEPGDVATVLPLRTSHPAGGRVLRLAPLAPQPPVPLRRDARPADRTLFVASLATLPDGADVRLTGGPAPDEFQRISRIEATSDAGGYFALPPMHRVAALALVVTAPVLAPVALTLHPEYAGPEQWLDVVFA